MQIVQLSGILIAMAMLVACASTSPSSAIPSITERELVLVQSGFACSKNDDIGNSGTETHRCYFHPVHATQQNLSTPVLRAAFVTKQFSLTCRKVEVLSDTPFRTAEQQDVVLNRVGFRCES
jgi:hypothetical protein